MFKRIFFFIAIVFPLFVSAQNNSGFYKNQIKFSPFRVIDLSNTGMEISYERMHSEKFSTQFSYTFDKDILGFFPFDNFRGYRLSVEEKYFFKSVPKYRKYVSVDLVLNNNKYTDEISYRDSVLGGIGKERFLIHRKTFSVNIKYGKQFLLKRFIIDGCIGAGIKWRNIVSDNVHPLIQSKGIDLISPLRTPGRNLTFNLPINVKIGYIF